MKPAPRALLTHITFLAGRRRWLRLCGAGDLEGLQVALNARQRVLAAHAATALAASRMAAAEQLPWDFWTIDLREAVRRLGEITGEDVFEWTGYLRAHRQRRAFFAAHGADG